METANNDRDHVSCWSVRKQARCIEARLEHAWNHVLETYKIPSYICNHYTGVFPRWDKKCRTFASISYLQNRIKWTRGPEKSRDREAP